MTKRMDAAQIKKGLKGLAGWTQIGEELVKVYSFEDYYEVMAFVNAVAWVSHKNNHHPDMEVGYNKVKVRYSTHDVGGISVRDFDCAKVVEGLLA